MRKLRYLWSAPVLALVLAGSAHATTLVSQGLRVAPGDVASCTIVNAGTKEIAVLFELVNNDGSVAGEDDASVLPGGEGSQAFPDVTGGLHCRFTGAFSKRDVRASMNVTSPPGFGTIATAPAQ